MATFLGSLRSAPSRACNARLWGVSAPQEITSAGTSINASQLPRVFSAVEWRAGTVNADIGGGRFDNATAYLAQRGVRNVIFDPYNRSAAHNAAAAAKICGGRADTATVANVLNVIREPSARAFVLAQAFDAVRPGGTAFMLIYEGNRSGQGTQTSKGWQENRKADSYLPEIARVFPHVERRGSLIISRKGP